jgi:Lon protease-like protein
VDEQLRPLPLFPLRSVLFPNMLMALHIFEDHYRQMIGYCLDSGSPFGVVLIRHGSEVHEGDVDPYLVGTAAHVRDVEKLDGGRMNVLAQGMERFRVREIDSSQPYLVGMVQKVEDLPWSSTDEEARALELAQDAFQDLADVLTDRLDFRVDVRLADDPSALSFAMAGMLEIEQLGRQHLLEVTDTAERFTEMLPLMRDFVTMLRGPSLHRADYQELKELLHPN